MNFVKCGFSVTCISKKPIAFGLFLTILLLPIYLFGCSDQVTLPTAEKLAEFENAGPLRPTVDIDRLVKAKIGGGPYKVVPGDVLELTMPAILQAVTDEESGTPDQAISYPFRVSESGTINLSTAGEIKVAGKTLSQIESAVIDAYYPAYTVTQPSVFARVMEYETAKVSITGAVNKPGIYSLRSDQMSLVALIMEAGGIVDEGAVVIKILRRDQVVPNSEEAVIETVKEVPERPVGLNKTKHFKFISRDPGSNDLEISLRFRQAAPSGTIGTLTIMHDQKRLLTEQTDLADKGERLLLLGKLARTEPRVSIVDVDQKLCKLAELLKARYGKHNGGGEGINAKMSSNINLSSLQSAYFALRENLGRRESRVWNTNLETRLSPRAKRVLLEHNHAVRNSEDKTVNENISSNPELSTSYLGQNSTANEVLGEEAIEISGLDRRQTSKRITESGKPQGSETLVLPVKGLNIPFADVALQDGDSVIVERMELPLFSVIGLVNRPGNFPYPPDVQYNLMQALAFAGGFNLAAEPRYAAVYRLKPDGTIVSAIFKVVDVRNGSQLTDALNVHIQPGDIVAVEHTPRTRTKLFLDRVFRINIGTYFRMEELWD